jgi:hypothetical protein
VCCSLVRGPEESFVRIKLGGAAGDNDTDECRQGAHDGDNEKLRVDLVGRLDGESSVVLQANTSAGQQTWRPPSKT